MGISRGLLEAAALVACLFLPRRLVMALSFPIPVCRLRLRVVRPAARPPAAFTSDSQRNGANPMPAAGRRRRGFCPLSDHGAISAKRGPTDALPGTGHRLR